MPMTEDEARTKREARIAQLLRKAESASPEEAEALTELAEKLMLQHGINQAVINAKRLGQDRTAEKIVEKIVTVTGIYAKATLIGYSTIGTVLGLKVLGSSGKEICIYLIGYEADVDQAITLLASLQMQAVVGLRNWWGNQTFRPSGMDGYKARRSYVVGFYAGAARRIEANRLTVISEVNAAQGGGSELVLVDRAAAVEKWTNDRYTKLRKSRGMQVTGGYGAGVADGRNANTGDKSISIPAGIGG